MPNFLHRWKLFFKENKRDKCLNAHPLLDLLIQSFNYKNLFLNINLNNHANRIVSLVSVLDKRHHKTRPVGQRCDLKCVIIICVAFRVWLINDFLLAGVKTHEEMHDFLLFWQMHDRRTNGWMNRQSYRNARSHLKRLQFSMSLWLSFTSLCQDRLFLDASSHLYERLCPSVSPSVSQSVKLL